MGPSASTAPSSLAGPEYPEPVLQHGGLEVIAPAQTLQGRVDDRYRGELSPGVIRMRRDRRRRDVPGRVPSWCEASTTLFLNGGYS